MPALTQIQLRRGTAAQWTTANPVLAAGEEGFETDTGRLKIGDGVTAWASLGYLNSGAPQAFEFNQAAASDTWTINHNLGRKVDVELYTVGGMEMLGDITHTSPNQAVVSFASPVAGSAFVH
jgi:hypothetical protein